MRPALLRSLLGLWLLLPGLMPPLWADVPVSAAAVREAQQRLAGQLIRTPFLHSPLLSKLTGAQVFVKLENLQATGAFKERGALNRLLQLSPEERKRGVITMSTGNHAQGVARHATRRGIPATVYTQESTPVSKVERTRALGATVVIKGATFDDTAALARAAAREQGLILIHPYDDPAVIAGQGTLALEMLQEQPDLDALIIPVGGGGLITGCALAARSIKPDIQIYGVESTRYSAMAQRLEGRPVQVGGTTVAEAIAVRDVGATALSLLPGLILGVLLVEEDTIEWAVAALAANLKVVAEGAGATPLAALVTQPTLFAGKKVGLVLSGGNMDNAHLADILRRYKGTLEDKPPIQVPKPLGKEVIGTPLAPVARGPYSQAIRHGDLLFLSGQLATDPKDGRFRSDLDIEGQTRQVMENLKAVLAAAGLTLENVLSTTVYLADPADFARMNQVYGTFFSKAPPARATVGAVLPVPGARVEIAAIAGR